SGEASATVRVIPDPTFACTDVLGKVYDDANRNGTQDKGEGGLQGVRLVTTRGLVATTDPYGRFHITCAVVPNEDRGSNFILKLDDRTLPSGYRMTTRRSQVKRATQGKALRFNYGASIDRVVGLDLADAVFEPDTTQLREHWKGRIQLLLDELLESPATLRLSYVADVEDPKLVKKRVAAVKKAISQTWAGLDAYLLEIETEVFWRRGAPSVLDSLSGPRRAVWGSVTHWLGGTPKAEEAESSHVGERHLPSDEPLNQWAHDPELLDTERGDRLEEREVFTPEIETVKLTDVVPPIRFESGVADIPASSVQRLRGVLAEMQHLDNVRLHLVGHADDQPLSPGLAASYGDNEGLSRERAGEVAEYIQSALALPPESISFGWAGDGDPVASNASEKGRAQNRRVEVEVWYDEIGSKLSLEEVVIPRDIKRVKICRQETVCKMRFREGHERRARVKNLIAPLNFADGAIDVPADFTSQVEQALHNLRGKQNVTVKFVGFTDDVPLTGRGERIYGTHLALSKARAHRVALAIKGKLDLPSSAVASDGRGAARPVASNTTARGRALNRRVEVEFWYDDPLQELPGEPQLCPEAGDAELLTRIYDPPGGGIEPLQIDDGAVLLPPGYTDDLQRALEGVEGKTNSRLRFVGYTSNERLDRRTAMVYGDDIGLSAARARRAMGSVQTLLALADTEVEHEGRGYIHSNDVVNGGFIQGETSHVVVQVVYDELAVRDDLDGIEITPITRELKAKDPLALNLMRITVDGEPVDDPGRSSADIQRCTDVALERADIRFRFDDLGFVPRLSVTSDVRAVTLPSPAGHAGSASGASKVRFKAFSNYAHLFERSEVRIFAGGASLRSEPLAVVEVGRDGLAEWAPELERFAGPVGDLQFTLRAYDAKGRFDETAPQSLWMVYGEAGASEEAPAEESGLRAAFADKSREKDPLLAGYGETGPLLRNIPLGNVGTIRVDGSEIPAEHTVYLAGAPVPVDENGDFVAELALAPGMHTVEVAVLDEAGNGELFLRDLELQKSDWFYMGIADFTFSANKTNGPMDALEGENAQYDRDSNADGRLAFYVNGKFGKDWRLTASADTREGPVKDLFSNFLDKTPVSLFRRIDPDYFYPTFGDDGTVDETAPTMGKFYARLDKGESHALWGNFRVGYTGNELALVERGLYGAKLHFETEAATRFGEKRLTLDGFAADPGTVPSWEDFRGTGGSLYYLRHRDILIGSERVRIEVRDKDSGIVTAVVNLSPVLDYDIDWLQGRLLLSEPVSSTVDDNLLVRDQGLSGNEAWVVVQYEYTPGFSDLDTLAAGGQGQLWVNDYVKLGFTANHNDEDDTDSSLYAADLTLRKSNESWIKLQAGRSEGQVSVAFRSDDGGFNFLGTDGLGLEDADAYAYRADLSVGFADLFESARGRFDFYYQRRDAGYTAPGLTTLKDTDQYGGTFGIPLTRWLDLAAKADRTVEKRGLETTALEVDLDYQITELISLSAGVRSDMREDGSLLVPSTQQLGDRTDLIVEGAFDPGGRWRGYAFGQATVDKSGSREANNRGGVGGAYRLNERIELDGEVSYGDSGPAVKMGTSIQETEHTRRYLSYSLENERGDDGLHARRGNLVTCVRSRLSESSSVYQEDRWQHSKSQTGMSRAMGISLAPSERWRLGADWEFGTLIDRRTQAETDRNAGGVSVGYSFDKVQFSSGIEYRYDETEALDSSLSDRTTWLFRNSLKLQVTPDWRLLGKLDHSFSDSSEGEFYDGGYTEAVLGYAYRPVRHDRLNALFKYTYFFNKPTTDQVARADTAAQFLQRSHILSADVTYDLTPTLSVGAKYAYRRGEVSLDRVNPEYFDNNAHLFVLRGDWRFLKNWESTAEGRMLHMPDLDEHRAGAVLMLYRYLLNNFKVGVGYNFTNFSDDLTDLSYDHHGLFFNFVGSL
ncbi:MAG: OmpA family protein, partial [Deltaproteobacteria bacterium]|nr:OmpA family protein [Deltaproteobacteria bacterium]